MLDIIFQIVFYSLPVVILLCIFWIFKILFYTIEGINYGFTARIIIFFSIIFIGTGSVYGFYLWLENAEMMQPVQILTIEKPDSISEFPPAPEFLQVGDEYFAGPWSIEKQYQKEPGIWIILCKDDIIGIGEFTGEKEFSPEEKQCFMRECTDPYYAVLPIFEEGEPAIVNYIVNKFNLVCNYYE